MAILEKNQKLVEEIKALKMLEEKLKQIDRLRDAEIQSMQSKRLAL
jgi:hypothetical protein